MLPDTRTEDLSSNAASAATTTLRATKCVPNGASQIQQTRTSELTATAAGSVAWAIAMSCENSFLNTTGSSISDPSGGRLPAPF